MFDHHDLKLSHIYHLSCIKLPHYLHLYEGSVRSNILIIYLLSGPCPDVITFMEQDALHPAVASPREIILPSKFKIKQKLLQLIREEFITIDSESDSENGYE